VQRESGPETWPPPSFTLVLDGQPLPAGDPTYDELIALFTSPDAPNDIRRLAGLRITIYGALHRIRQATWQPTTLTLFLETEPFHS
jgi:hypothetical protein